jgi:hypothetical protein
MGCTHPKSEVSSNHVPVKILNRGLKLAGLSGALHWHVILSPKSSLVPEPGPMTRFESFPIFIAPAAAKDLAAVAAVRPKISCGEFPGTILWLVRTCKVRHGSSLESASRQLRAHAGGASASPDPAHLKEDERNNVVMGDQQAYRWHPLIAKQRVSQCLAPPSISSLHYSP